MQTRLLALALGAALAAAAVPAAAGTYGSASWATARSCAAVTAGDPCDGEGPGQGIFLQDREGGAGREAFASFDVAGVGFAKGTVTFGTLDLPVISGLASAT